MLSRFRAMVDNPTYVWKCASGRSSRPMWLVAALMALALLGFILGLWAWDKRASTASFYQSEFSAAVSLACGRGFRAVYNEKQDQIAGFLEVRNSTLTCDDAFSAANAPTLGEPNILQQQTVSLQYLFAALWRALGFNWNVARFIAGALLAGYATASFAFSRTLLAAGPAVAMAAGLTLWMGSPYGHVEHLRDFSKAPFVMALAAVFVSILFCGRQQVVRYAAVAALLTAIGIGFRTDVAMFILLIPLALIVRALSDWRRAVAGLVLFVALAASYDALVLNYSAGMGRNSAHFAILGQSAVFTNGLKLGDDHQGGLYTTNDLFTFELVRMYSMAASMPEPKFGTPGYDAASRAMFWDYVKAMPANIILEAITAAFQSMFRWVSGSAERLAMLLLAGFVLTSRFHWRGVAAFAIATFVCAITAVQFGGRHYFHSAAFGIVFTAVLVAVGLHDGARLLASRKRFLPAMGASIWIKNGLVPELGGFKRGFAFAFGVAVIAAFGLLEAARAYQTAGVERRISVLATLPPATAIPENPGAAGAASQSFSGANIGKSSYVKVALKNPALCRKFPRLSVEYAAKTSFFDWSFTARRPAGQQSAIYFPLPKYDTNAVRNIVVNGTTLGCEVAASTIEPKGPFLPFVFYEGDLARPPFLESAVVDGPMLRPRETWKSLFGRRTCLADKLRVKGDGGMQKIAASVTVPQLVRFDVTDGGDGVWSDHFNIGAAAFVVEGRAWALSNFAIAWEEHGLYAPVLDKNFAGQRLDIADRVYADGFGMHSPLKLVLRVPDAIRGKLGILKFDYGIDSDTKGAGSLDFSACLME